MLYTSLIVSFVLSILGPSSRPQASALQPHRIGALAVWTLQDAEFPLPASLLKGLDAAEARPMLGGKDAATTPANAFLVKMPGHLVLVDTGVGKSDEADSGHLLERLASAGFRPEEIDTVLITHEHFDHVGGLLTPAGARAFPKALVWVPKSEHDYWSGDPAKLPEAVRDRGAKVKALFQPYAAANALRLFADDAEVMPGIKAVTLHGHTAGHTMYLFTSEGQELWCVGDLVHFPAVQFARPEVGVSFDLDGPTAIRVRQEWLRRAAAAKAVLADAHVPGLVRLETKGTGYVAVAVSAR